MRARRLRLSSLFKVDEGEQFVDGRKVAHGRALLGKLWDAIWIHALGNFLQALGEHRHRPALLTGQRFWDYGERLIGVGIRRINNMRHQIIPGASHQSLWYVLYGSQFAD